ncbi:MAG: type II toxin-antitoxin system VapC family toxin [Candidatus Baldrarchaeia archaeon]
MSLVIDTSVYIDRYSKDPTRKNLAKKLFNLAEKLIIYEPRIFIIELLCVLSRKTTNFKSIINKIEEKINIVNEEELFDTARQLAPLVHGRAIDLYFIATTKLTNSILITCDKLQAINAKKAKIQAYHLIKEFSKTTNKIKQLIKHSQHYIKYKT